VGTETPHIVPGALAARPVPRDGRSPFLVGHRDLTFRGFPFEAAETREPLVHSLVESSDRHSKAADHSIV